MNKVCLILCFPIFLLFVATSASAATVISPIVELRGERGQTIEGFVRVYNETEQQLDLEASIRPFSVEGRAKDIAALWNHVSWFELSQSEITLSPKQAVVIPFTVTIPSNVSPGGYYAVIFWKTVIDDQAAVSVASEVGTLALLTVDGDLTEEASIDFAAVESKKIYWGFPINFSAVLKNNGTVHLNPAGNLDLKNWFGTIAYTPANVTGKVLLPGAEQRFEYVLPATMTEGNFFSNFIKGLHFELQNLTFGPHQAVYEIGYGVDSPTVVTKQVDFVVIPAKLISTLFLILILGILLLLWSRKSKGVKNK